MTESYGIIHAVDERLMGTELLAAADDEDTVLEVEDVHDFVGDGERITVGDEQHVVVAIEESDSGPSTITIADGLADPWPAETRVLLHPPSPVSTAFVAVDGDPANQAVWHVPMALKPLLRRGVRAPEDREHVRGVRTDFGRWIITDILHEPEVLRATPWEDEAGMRLLESFGFLRYFRRRTTNQNILNTTSTAISFPTLIEDFTGFSILESATEHRLPRHGHYLIISNVRWAGDNTGLRTVFVQVSTNGGATWDSLPMLIDRRGATASASLPNVNFTNRLVGDIHVDPMQMMGDGMQFRIVALQSSGGTLAIEHASLLILYLTSHGHEDMVE